MQEKQCDAFEEFFSSLGVATVTCTLVVSIGKLLTPYYLFYILFFSIIVITSFIGQQYYQLETKRSTNGQSKIAPNELLVEHQSFPSPKIKKRDKRRLNEKLKPCTDGNMAQTKQGIGKAGKFLEVLSSDTKVYMSSAERGTSKVHPGISRKRKSGIVGITT